jgi:hypothetical protein
MGNSGVLRLYVGGQQCFSGNRVQNILRNESFTGLACGGKQATVRAIFSALNVQRYLI